MSIGQYKGSRLEKSKGREVSDHECDDSGNYEDELRAFALFG
jgi:hypothetical protein